MPQIAPFLTWILGRVVQLWSPESSGPKIDHISNRFGPYLYIGEFTDYATGGRQFLKISVLLGSNLSGNMEVRIVNIPQKVGNLGSAAPEIDHCSNRFEL